MICHVSFGRIDTQTPEEWLKSVPYFTRILSTMAERTSVVSIHFAMVTKTVSFEGVTYKFLKSTEGISNVTEVVRSLKPKAIILHGFHSIVSAFRFASRMKDFKLYVQHHGEKVFTFPKSLIQKRIDKYIAGYFFSAKDMAEEWIKAGLIRNSIRVTEIPEVTSSFPVVKNQAARIKKMNFIWVGRLDSNKDPITLLDGFISFLKVQPDANLLMIFGTNELLAEVQSKAREFKDNIHLIGKMPHNEMPTLYAKVDFIISTSLFEAGGVSVLEAMSCGCIPILSDIPSFRKISNSGRVGLLFQGHSPTQLTDALTKSQEIDVASEREKVLMHFEKNFSTTAIADRIIDVTYDRKEQASALR